MFLIAHYNMPIYVYMSTHTYIYDIWKYHSICYNRLDPIVVCGTSFSFCGQWSWFNCNNDIAKGMVYVPYICTTIKWNISETICKQRLDSVNGFHSLYLI